MSGNLTINRTSVEYVKAIVTADVDLDATGVELAIVRGAATPTWLPAAWVEDAGVTRTARTSSVVTFSLVAYPQSSYRVLVRLTDVPEVPIVTAYTLTLV